MKPTAYLRYIEVEHKANTALCTSSKHGEDYYYRLQAWWEDGKGNGEWRFVEIDFEITSGKPY